MGWRSLISREAVSGSLQSLQGFGFRAQDTTSKLKFPNQAAGLPKPKQNTNSAALTPVGRTVQATSSTVSSIARTPRYFAHAATIALVGAIVLGGSVSGHAARLSNTAFQGGYGSVLDQAAAADVAAKVADQTSLIVAKDATSTASTLNSQVSMVTSGDDTLAARQVVDTAGATSKDVHTYKVQAGDTLGSIAANFNITSDTIRWANNLDGDTLKPGQSLVILPISGIEHTVAAGETADSLATKYQSNAEQIIAFNNAEVKGLQVGSSIIVPDGVMPQVAKPAPTAAPATASSARLTHFVGNGNGYAFGYCTYYVASRRSVPSDWGNAIGWYYNAQLDGFGVGSTPVPGAIAWTGAGYYGHVAYVESVSGGMVTVSEMNYNGNWDRVTYRTVPASTFRYIY